MKFIEIPVRLSKKDNRQNHPFVRRANIAILRYEHHLVRPKKGRRIFCIRCGAALSGDERIMQLCPKS